MDARISISENELLQALADIEPPPAPADAMTAAEIRAAKGYKSTTLKTLLAQLRAEGRLETWQVTRTDAAGRAQRVPAYTIKPAPKRKR